MVSLVSTRVSTRAREALRREAYGPVRTATSLPHRSLGAVHEMLGPCPVWPSEPEHPRRRLCRHGEVMEEAVWLRAENYCRRSGGTGRLALRARMRRTLETAQALQAPGGTSTPGINLHIKD